MTDSLLSDEEVHELKLGQSFDSGGAVAYHSVCYDFKPASIDVEQPAVINIEPGNKVTVTVPHVKGSSMPHTVYSGSKQPSQKDYALIINHDTGEIVLEKLTYKFNLKRMASEKRSIAEKRPALPAEKQTTPPTTVVRSSGKESNDAVTKSSSNAEHLTGSSSSSDESEESSSSDDNLSDGTNDSDNERKTVSARQTRSNNTASVPATNPAHHTRSGNPGAMGSFDVCEDLQLSESESDDDE